MQGCSVLCVLIGNQTYTRQWVYYEIFKSIERGMGVFGVRVHQNRCPKNGVDSAGLSPFECAGYGTSNGMYVPMIHNHTGWVAAPNLSPISQSAAPYLKGTNKPMLNSLFRVYDWVDDDGYNNFARWIETSARQAGR